MDNNFTQSMAFILKWEAGYVDNPKDPGGETRYGISKRAHPELDIKNLTVERALEIYHEAYWLKSGCQYLEMPLAAVVMNIAVQSGVRRALKILEDSDKSWQNCIFHFKNFLVNLNKPDFIRGWINRLNDLSKFCTIHEQDHPKEK